MTIFLIVFFLYILLRLLFRERQKRAGNIYMVGSRFPILPDYVRSIAIVGMVGIALLIVIVTIMGYQLTPDHISYMLTLGIIVMSIQYLPLFIVGEHGLVSLDTQVNWKDITSAHVQKNTGGGTVKIKVDFQTATKLSTIDVYVHASQTDDFEKIVNEFTSIQIQKSGE